MTLQLENSYTNKQGMEVPLKRPRVKLMGKAMNDNERWVFEIRSNVVERTTGTFPEWSVYANVKGNATEFVLSLTAQAYMTFKNLGVQKGDSVEVWKEFKENDKTGALMPIIGAKLLNRTPTTNPGSPQMPKSNTNPFGGNTNTPAKDVPPNPFQNAPNQMPSSQTPSKSMDFSSLGPVNSPAVDVKVIIRKLAQELLDPKYRNQVGQIANDFAKWKLLIANQEEMQGKILPDTEWQELYKEWAINFNER